jgi:hypothetical protein
MKCLPKKSEKSQIKNAIARNNEPAISTEDEER